MRKVRYINAKGGNIREKAAVSLQKIFGFQIFSKILDVMDLESSSLDLRNYFDTALPLIHTSADINKFIDTINNISQSKEMCILIIIYTEVILKAILVGLITVGMSKDHLPIIIGFKHRRMGEFLVAYHIREIGIENLPATLHIGSRLLQVFTILVAIENNPKKVIDWITSRKGLDETLVAVDMISLISDKEKILGADIMHELLNSILLYGKKTKDPIELVRILIALRQLMICRFMTPSKKEEKRHVQSFCKQNLREG